MRLSRRDLRLTTGLVLFGYVALHLLNHALGLVSVTFAERGLELALKVWHSPPGTIVLYGSAGVHVALAFEALHGRRTLRMAPLDLVRIVLGLGIPTLLITHAVSTRLAWEMYGLSPRYSRVVWSLWRTDGQGLQLALLVPGWLHGCFGIHLAFANRAMYQRLHRALFALALLLPVLGGLGFLAMGKELASDRALHGQLNTAIELPRGANAALLGWREALLGLYFSALGGVLLARVARSWRERRSDGSIAIRYPGRTIRVPRGWSVLEASRSHHVPHLSVCGGRARCSTCRVRVTSGAQHCPPVQATEAATLQRIQAREGVRLACQLRPRGDIAVIPLLTASAPGEREEKLERAVEQDVVLVCVDWRNREPLARAVLPQDAVFLAADFRRCVTLEGRGHEGLECNSSVDATVLVFGIGIDPTLACQRALSAASDAERALSELADRWNAEFGVTADFSICIHRGPAAIGGIGGTTARRYAAAGPAVDDARRLRSAPTASRIMVSIDVLRHSGIRARVLDRLRLVQLDAAPGLSAVAPKSLHRLARLAALGRT